MAIYNRLIFWQIVDIMQYRIYEDQQESTLQEWISYIYRHHYMMLQILVVSLMMHIAI